MLNSQRVRAQARLKDLALTDLSVMLGRQKFYLYSALRGECKPSRAEIERLAEILDTTPDYLEGGTDNPNIVQDTDEFVDIYRLVNNRPSTKLLFSALKGASDEDIKRTIEILNALKRTNGEL